MMLSNKFFETDKKGPAWRCPPGEKGSPCPTPIPNAREPTSGNTGERAALVIPVQPLFIPP
jgi:hypothetical protein